MKTLKDTILSLNQEEIYSLYLSIPVADINWSTLNNSNKIANSHRNENNPSMSFRWFGDKLIARDFGDSRYNGDVFRVVGYIINKNCMETEDFIDICNDILETYYSKKHKKKKDYEIIKDDSCIKDIDFTPRLLQKRDYDYFNSFGILNRNILDNVTPVLRYSINGKVTGYRNSYTDPCYHYTVNYKFSKLYFPFRNKKSPYPRFITNNILALDDITDIRKCKDCIIVKSIKDKMLLNQILELLNIKDILILTASSEISTLPLNILYLLKENVEHNIYSMFDIDNTGMTSMELLQSNYDIKSIIFSTLAKDPTDYCKSYGYNNTINTFKIHINLIINNRTKYET